MSNNSTTKAKWFKYVKDDNKDGIKRLLEEGVDIDTRGREQVTALMYALEKGHIDMVKLLIEKGADMNAQDTWGHTVLMCASDIATARLLIEEGADINFQNKYGGTALLFFVSVNKHIDMVRLLIEKGADTNIQNTGGYTALMSASMTGRTDVVKLLIENGADIFIEDKDGKTALDYSDTHEIRKILLKIKEKRNENSGQELAIGYEKMTRQSAKPGTGPANLIRKFAGIQSPRGYKKNRHGGSRKRRTTRRTRKRRL